MEKKTLQNLNYTLPLFGGKLQAFGSSISITRWMGALLLRRTNNE